MLPLACIATVGLAFSALCVAGTENAGADDLFCKSQIVRDYERPLTRLPNDRVPSRERLAFAPARVLLANLSPEKTALAGAEIGYEVEVAGSVFSDGQLKRPIRLDWNIDLRLSTVDLRGEVLQVVAQRHQRIGILRRRNGPQLYVRGRPGIYRFDATIRARGGKLLKSYYRYIRILPRRAEFMIAMNQTEFRPGDVALGQIQNVGTLPLFLGSLPFLEVEEYVNGEWTLTTEAKDAMVVGTELVLLGGRASPCREFLIPQNAKGRQYRLKALIEVGIGSGRRNPVLTKRFSVG